MIYKKFNDRKEAIAYRESEWDKKNASSLFEYGNNRYLVKVWESETKEDLQTNQRILSNRSWQLKEDIDRLTEAKQAIESPDYANYSDYEGTLAVAKMLEEEHYFRRSQDVIDFFENPDKDIDNIKELIKEALENYDIEWNEYEESEV